MKKAFTLVETLITLTIIGIVASLTIPGVIANYYNQENTSGLQKAINTLNTAIAANIANEGQSPLDFYGDNLFHYFRRHMSFTSIDVVKHTSNPSLNNKALYTRDGLRFEFPEDKPDLPLWSGANLKSKTPNGRTSNMVCGSYGLDSNIRGRKALATPCIVLVDVNGDKLPSRPDFNIGSTTTSNYQFNREEGGSLGDVFAILITDEKAIPYGVVGQKAYYGK